MIRVAAFVVGCAIAATACPKEKPMPEFQVQIYTLPHDQQRYDTVGDWQFMPRSLHIRVSRMSDERYELLVGLHELIEAYLCKHAGISEAAVTAFDTGPGKDLDEPGDDPAAPYHKQHVFASKIERMVADELGVDWQAYEREIESK